MIHRPSSYHFWLWIDVILGGIYALILAMTVLSTVHRLVGVPWERIGMIVFGTLLLFVVLALPVLIIALLVAAWSPSAHLNDRHRKSLAVVMFEKLLVLDVIMAVTLLSLVILYLFQTELE